MLCSVKLFFNANEPDGKQQKYIVVLPPWYFFAVDAVQSATAISCLYLY